MTIATKSKIYLIAGEASGDLLGSRLMKALQRKGEVEFFGLGGDTMRRSGLDSLFDISELSVMGLTEVIPSIPRILRRIRQVIADIKERRPDVVITIDSWSFSSRIHKALRKLNLPIKQVHYVAPQVWAWKKRRAKTMYKYIDELLTLLPNEEKYFTPYHLTVDFVGHPVIESAALNADGKAFRQRHNIPASAEIISLLPGSRHNEVSRLLPDFLRAAELLYQQNNNLYFILPTVSMVEKKVRAMLQNTNFPLLVVTGEDERYGAFQASSAAIAASGTVALELAICRIPHIIAYKVSPLTYALAKHLVKIKYVNLTNILLNRLVIPELLQYDCTPENIALNIDDLLKQRDIYNNQMTAFDEIKQYLSDNEVLPSDKAAAIILGLCRC